MTQRRPGARGWFWVWLLMALVVAAWILPWSTIAYGPRSAPMAGFDSSHRAVIEGGINAFWDSTWTDPGKVLSDLSVVGGRIYGIQRGQLVAFSAKDGRRLWNRRLVRAVTQFVVGEQLIAAVTGGLKPRIVVVQAGSGDILWSRPTATDSRVVLSHGRLWVVGQRQLDEWSLASGHRVREVSVASATDNASMPIIFRGAIYFAQGSGHWYRVNLPDGRIQWTAQLHGFDSVGTPAISGGVLYAVAERPGTIPTMELLAMSTATGTVLWQQTLVGSMVHPALPMPVVYRGTVYVASASTDTVYAVDAVSGRVLWQNDLNQIPVMTTALPVAGQIIVGSANGIVWNLSAVNGQVDQSLHVRAGFSGGVPYLVGRTLYLSTTTGLDALRLGKIIARVSSGYRI